MRLILLSSVLFVVSVAFPVMADDVDNNGISDDIELLLAEKYRPAFILHKDRIIEPEPVEIMSSDGLGLDGNDLWCSFFSLTSGDWLVDGENDPLSLTSQPYNYVFDYQNDPIENRDDGLQFVAASHYPSLAVCSGSGCEVYLHLQYGSWGEELSSIWNDNYLNGGSACLPGSAFDPKVYAHLFMDGTECVIQYWIFYPYNDNINNHEGDWEHINVVLSAADVSTAEIVAIDFYFHERYMVVDGGRLSSLHFINDTHPLIYVGGYADLLVTGINGSGPASGGSYPGFGDWRDVGATIQILGVTVFTPNTETVEPGGKFINYESVDVEIYPRVDTHGNDSDNDGCGEQYFSTRPNEAWKRANIYWGQYITADPWSNSPLFNFDEDIGNRAPKTPAYKDAWGRRTNTGHEPYHRWEFFEDNGPMVVVSAICGGKDIYGTSASIIEHDGSGSTTQLVEMPALHYFSTSVQSLTVGVPAEFESDGVLYFFDQWDDLQEPECFDNVRVVSVSGINHTCLARYRDSALVDKTTEPFRAQYKVTNGVGWVDYDDDGDEDLMLALGEYGDAPVHSPENTLARNVGNGAFEIVSNGAGCEELTQRTPTRAAVWGDVDNDGDEDVYLVNGDEAAPDAPNSLLLNETHGGDPLFVSTIQGDLAAIQDANIGFDAEWVDLENDGDLDLVVGREGMGPLVLRNYIQPEGEASLQAESVPGLTDLSLSRELAFADWNNDGYVDLFSVLSTGEPVLLENQGDWSFLDVSLDVGLGSLASGGIRAAAWGDYDNDGDVDLFVGYGAGYQTPNVLLRNQGGTLDDVTQQSGMSVVEFGVRAVAWFDMDNDGDLDCVAAGAEVIFWENRFPSDYFVASTLFNATVPSEPRTIGIADYDTDGDEDVYFGVLSPIASGDVFNRLYENELGSRKNSIQILLDGEYANSNGVGARVLVYTPDGVVQSRQAVGAVGGSGRMSHTMTIGLGTNEEVQRVRVEWPWGRYTEEPTIPSGTVVTLSDAEPVRSIGRIYLTADPNGGIATTIGPVAPNQEFEYYLMYDGSGVMPAAPSLERFEVGVTLPGQLQPRLEERMFDGVNMNGTFMNYECYLNTCLDASAGAVALYKFRAVVAEEGYDPTIRLRNIPFPSFTDPLVPSVPCGWGCESGAIFRFDEPGASEELTVLIDDTRAPGLEHTGLWFIYRDWVHVRIDEPILPTTASGASLTDTGIYRVYNGDPPHLEKSITRVVVSGQDIYLELDSDIPENKYFRVEALGIRDVHGNTSPVLDGVVCQADPDDDGIIIEEGMPMPGKSVNFEWIELANTGSRSVCLNGWRFSSGGGITYRFAEEPTLVVQPGEFGVLRIDGDLMDERGRMVGVPAEEIDDVLDVDGLVVADPFGNIADVVPADSLSAKSLGGRCSIQRVADSTGRTVKWVTDAPEYAPGKRGTPGKPNRLGDGSIAEIAANTPSRTLLISASPNPFNPTTVVRMAVASPQRIRVAVYDIRGRLIKTLLDASSETNPDLQLVWDGRDNSGGKVASGVYFVRMSSQDSGNQILKVTLMK